MHFNTSLRDETPVLIRRLVPGDEDLIRKGMTQLSAESRYLRFMAAAATLSDAQLRAITNTGDRDQEAVGALALDQEPPAPAGIARYVRVPGKPHEAEVSVTVVDHYQGKGLGTLLLAVLAASALANGVTAFIAFVLLRNHRMLQVFEEMGAERRRVEESEVEMLIPLHKDPSLYPATPVGDVFRTAFRDLSPDTP
ncbi:MAG: GNAT family N-acetyltransferase [Pseudomonadota bacterium]